MEYIINPIAALLGTSKESYKIKEAQDVKGLSKNLFLFSIISALILGIITWLSPEVENQTNLHSAPNIRQFIIFGSMVYGLFIPIVTIICYSCIWWVFFSDVGFRKILTIQLYGYAITLINLFTQMLFMLILDMNNKFSLLSLGVISELYFENKYIIAFFNNISFFWLWGIVFQFITLSVISKKSKLYVSTIIITLNVFSAIVLAAWS
ncbi:hypothetical protein [Bacillus thuringiensis]|uniref:hypothetical protein n=1 Tax=Bacillus thuringiensis TaxID=1428 RepID=UPI000B43C43F|nr:hypothetical protein [Bacillus thuringiensis]MCU4957519.1 transmembrane protein 268 [Bacillus cereus]MED3180877.1 hypothetical protein [Bacillus thuringiensis]OTX99646.1 hypothetical protein BK734_31250 [Bacillus thuringiensis serovar kim]OUB12788.1 hypothetical protein BK733_31000 [Bacillus thuringiensis serovar xiaguangiensis]